MPARPINPLRLLFAFADARYIDRPACDAAVARMHARDGIGDRVHLWLACLGLFLLSGPMTVTELAFAPLGVFFFVRVFNTAPVWIHAAAQPAVLCAAALAGWLGVTLLWTPDVAQGLDEIGRLRWFLLTPLIYPAIEHRQRLVLALALGLMAATVAQLLSGFPGLHPPFPLRHPGRVSGWWQPVVAGSIQCGAVGLFLPGALAGAGRARVVGVTGLALSLVGLLATGTRGAWLAAVLFLLVAVPCVLRRADRPVRRRALVFAAGAAVALVGAGIVFRAGVLLRVEQARTELAAAIGGDLDSPTGARIAVMIESLEAGGSHLLGGLGAGAISTMMGDGFGPDHAGAGMDHAHSTPAHLLASGGLPALALGGLLFFVMLRNGVRAAPTIHGSPDPARALERGLPYALAALGCAGLFDAVLINTQTCALIGALAALSPGYAPGVRTGTKPAPDGTGGSSA